MIDLWNTTLIVKGIEYDGLDKWHVMDKCPKLRTRPPYYYDDEGNKYYWELKCFRRTEEDGLFEYLFIFTDPDLTIPAGTVLHAARENWMKDVPDSKVIRLEYKETCSYPEIDEANNLYFRILYKMKITADISGDTMISKPVSNYIECNKEASFSVPAKRTETLFAEMLRCVSEVDCFKEDWVDAKSRKIIFYFEGGEKLECDGVFCHGDENTVNIMHAFLKEYML